MLKNFFNISDFSSELLRKITNNQIEQKSLKGKNIGLLFEKYSTRTRLSFQVGISQINGNVISIRFEDLNISRDESFEDTFLAMNCYLDGLVYRTADHNKLIKASNYFKKPIINALSDLSHPCQILSDLYTLNEKFSSLNINILWMGDMNNVCYSLVEATNMITELNLTICTPKEISDKIKWQLGSSIKVVNNINDININSINCVMTDVFISMNDKDSKSKINLLKPYCVNSELMSSTSSDSVFMHCLPAKVGLEVSEDVFRGQKSIVWKQAQNRMIAQKNMLQVIDWS